MSSAVIDLGFGDCGKGRTVSYLCSVTKNPIVVRFNGGHQAGHGVLYNGIRHIFSSFGSGTLQGVPTYWSKNCTFFPIAVLNEYNALKRKIGTVPKLFVHPLCPVTTPFDIIGNAKTEKINNHGSVGVGFGATLQRHESFHKIFVQDLFYEQVLTAKLRNIAKHYNPHLYEGHAVDLIIDNFIKIIPQVLSIITMRDDRVIESYEPIFEGAQGVLLDQDFGFFPNVTRSNTTSQNAIEMHHLDDIYYVTRTYQTRHGNGFMTNEILEFPSLKNTENETNQTHDFQGVFRKTILDIDLLNYALQCDKDFHKNSNIDNFQYDTKKNLVITCVDQTGDRIQVTKQGKLMTIPVYELPSHLNVRFNKILYCSGENIKDVKSLADLATA